MMSCNRFLLKCRYRARITSPAPSLSCFFSTAAASSTEIEEPRITSSSPEPPPRRALRSLGKQSAVLPHFQRDAIAFRRIIEESRWNSKLERSLVSSSIPLSDGLVVEVIKALSEAKLALRFFIWIVQQQDLVPSGNVVGVLSRRWCHEKQFNRFLKTLDSAQRSGIQSLTPDSLLILLTGYGWAGMAEKALQTLDSLMSSGFDLDASHFMCVLGILEHEQLFDSIMPLYQRMLQVGFHPDSGSYNRLIVALCIAGKKEDAMDLLDGMKSKGFCPALETYRIILSMFSKANRVSEVLKIFSDILDSGFEPDSKAYNALIKAFCLSEKLCEALEVLEGVLDKDMKPNLVSLNMVVDGLFNLGDSDKIFGLWRKLNKHKIPTLTLEDKLIITLCKAGKITEAETVSEELRSRDISLSEDAYKAFISALCESGNFEKANEFLIQMKEEITQVDDDIVNIVQNGLSKVENVLKQDAKTEDAVHEDVNVDSFALDDPKEDIDATRGS